MLATYNYTQAEMAIVGTNPTIEQMVDYLTKQAISPLCYAKYCAEKPKQATVEMKDTGSVALTTIRQRWGGVILYPSEWAEVKSSLDAVMSFIDANRVELDKRCAANKAKKEAEKAAAKAAKA